ncbi:tetratricopeptide repeat protein [Nonomuraea sp. JJY05]|uniref:tetratricopeptide repeat protein n=1 Tax=Nonomuraea sp. JJY05 TaxID=3350255 RepID=UPI00373F368A
MQTALKGPPRRSRAFTGRDRELAELTALLDPAGPQGEVAQVAVLAGTGGIGKTELAVQAAHAAWAKGWFPGGVLFVDLLGYDPQRRREPSAVLDGMLRAAGVPGEHIPAEEEDRSRLFASVMAAYAEAGRHVLVVIDNAASSAQARPLLPWVGKAVVTSRHTLADLDARILELDVLTPAASVDLLARQIRLTCGPTDTRVTDDPGSAQAIARLCAGFPLALHIVAANLATPHRSLAQMAVNLEGERTRLDRLRYAAGSPDDNAVRAAFNLSYQQLPPADARLFRLLTVNPGPDISAQAATVVSDMDGPEADTALHELARAHLIEPGHLDGRWRMHDLVRLFATDLADTHARDDDRPGALTALLAYYLATAQAAGEHLDLTDTGEEAEEFGGHGRGLAWLDAEYANLVAVVETTARGSAHHHIVRDLPLALDGFLDRRRRLDDWVTLTTHALAAARHLGDRYHEGSALSNLATAQSEQRRFVDALANYQQAVDIFREIGDLDGEGTALGNAGTVLTDLRRYHEAVTVHRRSLRIFRRMGNKYREGGALTNLGMALTHVQQFSEAITAYQQAADIFRQIDDRHGEGLAVANLAAALARTGRFSEATALNRQAAGIFHEVDDRYHECRVLEQLGEVHAQLERFDEAISVYRRAADDFRELGSHHNAGQVLARHGGVLTTMGQFGEAADVYQQAADAFREAGDHANELTALIHRDSARRALARRPIKAALARLRGSRRSTQKKDDLT